MPFVDGYVGISCHLSFIISVIAPPASMHAMKTFGCGVLAGGDVWLSRIQASLSHQIGGSANGRVDHHEKSYVKVAVAVMASDNVGAVLGDKDVNEG